MVNTTIYSVKGEKKGEVELPFQFDEEIRSDLIKRAVLAIQSTKYQPYGADPKAGTRQGFATPKRRKKYKTVYGRGVSRVMRKIMTRRGSQFQYTAAFVANVIKGRKAFPARAEKVIIERINTKERRKAIRSAIAATTSLELVSKKHAVGGLKNVPIVIEDLFEKTTKTNEVLNILNTLGLTNDLERTKEKKVRAGKGKMRGRKYKRKTGPLIVVGSECALLKGARNISGVDISLAKNLNAELLAPGAQPGRLVVWTQLALKELEGGLFK